MLTFKGEIVSINYRDDLSGEVIFRKDDECFTVPGEDISEFMKEYIIQTKISQVEKLSDKSLNDLIYSI